MNLKLKLKKLFFKFNVSVRDDSPCTYNRYINNKKILYILNGNSHKIFNYLLANTDKGYCMYRLIRIRNVSVSDLFQLIQLRFSRL